MDAPLTQSLMEKVKLASARLNQLTGLPDSKPARSMSRKRSRHSIRPRQHTANEGPEKTDSGSDESKAHRVNNEIANSHTENDPSMQDQPNRVTQLSPSSLKSALKVSQERLDCKVEFTGEFTESSHNSFEDFELYQLKLQTENFAGKLEELQTTHSTELQALYS